VIDHELGRHEGIDLVLVSAHVADRVADCREVDDRRHTGEVLHQYARGRECNLLGRLGLGVPLGEQLDLLLGD
jgi:hypothetical protein